MSKAFLSFAVLIVIFIVAGFIAKMVDHCYDRTTARDDSSDVSEHTRNLIRARLALVKFKLKGKSLQSDEEKKLATLRIWTSGRKPTVRRMGLANCIPSVGVQFNMRSVSLGQDTIQKAWRSSEHPGKVSDVILNVEELRERTKNASTVRQSTNIPRADLVKQPKEFNDAIIEIHSEQKEPDFSPKIRDILQKSMDKNITPESAWERPVSDDKACDVNGTKPEQRNNVSERTHSEQTNIEPLSLSPRKEVTCVQVEDI